MFQSQQQTERKDGRDIYLLLFNTQRSGKELKLCDKDREFVSLCMSFISCTISQTPPGLKWSNRTRQLRQDGVHKKTKNQGRNQ